MKKLFALAAVLSLMAIGVAKAQETTAPKAMEPAKVEEVKKAEPVKAKHEAKKMKKEAKKVEKKAEVKVEEVAPAAPVAPVAK
jgi:hypothetical protein